MRKRKLGRWSAALLATGVLCVMAAGCGGDDDEAGGAGTTAAGTTGGSPEGMLQSIGKGEGEVDLIIWAGYAEDGTTDPKVDWVTDFEKKTGCQVNSKVGSTSDEMVTLMRTGNYDGVSASGDATLRLIAAGDVAPVNTDLLENYDAVFEGLKNKPHNSVDGQMYGVPHGRGANLLMWRTDKVTPAPKSWSVVWDANSPYKGKITAYDSPIYIADAALYLMKTKPDLGIENPYELDDDQFQAAVDLLKQQRANIGEYWSDATKEIQAFQSGSTVVGTSWQYQANILAGDKAPVKTTLPEEGSTGWSDTWMISSKAKHPNCMYLWMDHIISPEANAKATEYFGEAPANEDACALTVDKNHCDTFHADDEDYFDQVWYWTTPIAQCLDGRTDVTCTDYSAWTKAWTEIRNS
jgi:putative spermidine/putrescine transport system substrate-binding protein